MVKEYAWSTNSPALSDTRTVGLNVPVTVGVPEIAPVAGSSVTPAGSEPACSAKLRGAAPPDAATVCEKAIPLTPALSDVGEKVHGSYTDCERPGRNLAPLVRDPDGG